MYCCDQDVDGSMESVKAEHKKHLAKTTDRDMDDVDANFQIMIAVYRHLQKHAQKANEYFKMCEIMCNLGQVYRKAGLMEEVCTCHTANIYSRVCIVRLVHVYG